MSGKGEEIGGGEQVGFTNPRGGLLRRLLAWQPDTRKGHVKRDAQILATLAGEKRTKRLMKGVCDVDTIT